MTSDSYNSKLHFIAVLTTAATFPLIFMGGLVTSHQAGLSVPDWPNSYGYNMFLFPPRLWIGGILYEHTHRLMGTVVGFLSIILSIVAWKTESRAWVRWLATSVLGAVIFQGILGGLRVVLLKLDLAIVHACFAQAFFCLTALVCVVTSKWWIVARDTGFQPVRKRLVMLSAACVVAIYAQLIVGATMRHYEAGLAIPDLPLAYRKLIPPTDEAALRTVNSARVWQMRLDRVTLGQVWLAFGHRIGAVLVTTSILWLAMHVVRQYRERRDLLVPAVALVGLLVVQLTLGVVTVLWRKPADIASAHVAVGALTLVTAFVLTARAMRLFVPQRKTMDNAVPVFTPSELAAAI